MKINAVTLKSFLQQATLRVGSILTIFMLMSFVDSSSLSDSVVHLTDNGNTITFRNNRVFINVESDDYVLSDDQMKPLPDYVSLDQDSKLPMTGIVGIEVNKTETLVDFVITPGANYGWLILSERTFLLDSGSNNVYKIRGVKGGIPLGELLILKGQSNQPVSFTLVFPPLGEDVKIVDFLEMKSATVARPAGGGELWRINNINVEQLKERKEKKFRIIE